MRLINTSTGALEEFIGRNIPTYTILSHTWEAEEVTYQDYIGGAFAHKRGYEKIKKTLEIAKSSNVPYAWVDTCCIDKSSSAELTETINSMYRWYERSRECYVYLSDLEAGVNLETQLQECRWFTRGWTLQELIAPFDMLFFDSQWNQVGTKRDLCPQLSPITGIPVDILSHETVLSSVCVAHKMSWAANRETTRIEDMAYCLLGIFDVNMPLLYGEESKAFRRLQEEIMRTTSDLSIFAWNVDPLSGDHRSRVYCGILAQSPAPFRPARSFLTAPSYGFGREFSICNIGVKTQSIIFVRGAYVLPVSCLTAASEDIGVRLRKIGSNIYVRDRPDAIRVYHGSPVYYVHGQNYVLIDDPPLKSFESVPDSNHLWKALSVGSVRTRVLSIELPARVNIEKYFGCFDFEDLVFFVPEGDRTDCSGMRFTVHLPYNNLGLDPRLRFKCVFYAFGWSTKESTMQFTVLDPTKQEMEMREIEEWLIQRANSQEWMLRQLVKWKTPKVSSIVFPIAGSKHSALVSLEPIFASHIIRVACKIVKTSHVTHEQSNNWSWY